MYTAYQKLMFIYFLFFYLCFCFNHGQWYMRVRSFALSFCSRY